MITLKEIAGLLLALIILAFSNSFIDANLFLKSLIFFAIILIIYTASKKIMALYVECEEETNIWTFQRYGFHEKSHFKNKIPIGIILSFLLSILSLGLIKWFAVLESDIKPTIARASKRHDFYSYSELTEWHLALICSSGILSMFILALISYLANFSDMARLCIYFAFFNMLPLGKLDGSRIFFGSRILYTILAILTAVGLMYALLVL